MKKIILVFPLTAVLTAAVFAADRPMRERGKEAGMFLDLQKISLGTMANVEQKKQYLSTVQLEKQRIQNYTLRMVYDNAYILYRRGDYQRAQELANVILSIDPSLTQAQTLATEAGRMATYGTISEAEIINMKFEEGISLYKMGRLLEAQKKFEEILVLRPNEQRAQEWVKRIDNEIAEQHIRRGFYAYKNGDYQEALNQWYSVLLIKKEDPELTAKIAEVEATMKKEESQKVLNQAFSLYSQGKLVPAYREFEKALEIQPGEQQTQKFIMQLKDEIAKGYYSAGQKAYGSKKYNSAIANWKEAKNWGYNQNEIGLMVKNAENAKIQAAEAARRKAAEPVKPKSIVTAPVEEDTLMPSEPLPTEKLSGVEQPSSPTVPVTSAPTEEFPAKVIVNQPGMITEEARQASIERYKAGIAYYNEGNYEKAKQEWQAALQLNPENSDAALGIKRIEAQYSTGKI